MEMNGTRRLLKPAKGTHDFVNEQMIIRGAFSILSDVFKRHAAPALDTPAAFETRDTLGKTRGGKNVINCDLAGQAGKPCSLKYEPFVRQEAMNGMASFKRCQISKVYRRDNPSKVRYQEF
jgi:histidyl-tRNA synthetase